MALMEYRVTYRRRGNKALQHRIFRQNAAAQRFVRSLDASQRYEPVEVCYVEVREVGRWERVWEAAPQYSIVEFDGNKTRKFVGGDQGWVEVPGA